MNSVSISLKKDKGRIYRVVMDVKYNGDPGFAPAVPAPLGSAIQREVSGVENTVPVMQFQGDATTTVSVPVTGLDKPVIC